MAKHMLPDVHKTNNSWPTDATDVCKWVKTAMFFICLPTMQKALETGHIGYTFGCFPFPSQAQGYKLSPVQLESFNEFV